MRRRPAPDLYRVGQLYSYDPIRGFFRHLHGTKCRQIGRLAGVWRPDGYINLHVDGKSYLAHHIAWYLTHSIWPDEVDHKNRIRSDNRLKNLRVATRNQNNGNSAGWAQEKRQNKLPRGVYKYHRKGWYKAQIVMNYTIIHLGCYPTVEDAQAAYQEAAKIHFGEFASAT